MAISGIRGVIFDMDGVILDSMIIWREIGPRFVRGKGYEPPEDLSGIIFSMSMEQGVKYFKENYQLEESEEEIMSELQAFLHDFYYNEVGVRPGARELMNSLRHRGIRITGATSSPRDHIEHALERNGLLGYVERLWTSAEVGSSKHDPEIFDLAAAFMGTAPHETLVFEDSLYALKTAKAAGYHTVGVYDALGEPDQYGLRAEAEVYVSDPQEFFERFMF